MYGEEQALSKLKSTGGTGSTTSISMIGLSFSFLCFYREVRDCLTVRIYSLCARARERERERWACCDQAPAQWIMKEKTHRSLKKHTLRMTLMLVLSLFLNPKDRGCTVVTT